MWYFHVTGTGQAADVFAMFEFLEHLTGGLAQDVGEHVQPSPMGHADDDLFHVFAAGALNEFVEQRDQGFAPLQGKALLSHIAGVEIFLQSFGRGQHGEQPALTGGCDVQVGPVAFEAFLDPAFLLGVRDVHVLGADVSAVDPFDKGDDIPQFHAVRCVQRAGVEKLVHVLFAQVMIFWV